MSKIPLKNSCLVTMSKHIISSLSTPQAKSCHGEVRCSRSAHLMQPCCDFYLVLDSLCAPSIQFNLLNLFTKFHNKSFFSSNTTLNNIWTVTLFRFRAYCYCYRNRRELIEEPGAIRVFGLYQYQLHKDILP